MMPRDDAVINMDSGDRPLRIMIYYILPQVVAGRVQEPWGALSHAFIICIVISKRSACISFVRHAFQLLRGVHENCILPSGSDYAQVKVLNLR